MHTLEAFESIPPKFYVVLEVGYPFDENKDLKTGSKKAFEFSIQIKNPYKNKAWRQLFYCLFQ
jgi:hypothetical protein